MFVELIEEMRGLRSGQRRLDLQKKGEGMKKDREERKRGGWSLFVKQKGCTETK